MKKILIVDDEPSLRSALREHLSNVADFQVFEAKHGLEALQILTNQPIDLMLLDINMPFLDGAELVKTLQAQPDKYAQPKILILTNRSDLSMVSEMVSLKIFDYIIKSDHSLDEITQIVQDKLS